MKNATGKSIIIVNSNAPIFINVNSMVNSYSVIILFKTKIIRKAL